jgi:hypothetical protein
MGTMQEAPIQIFTPNPAFLPTQKGQNPLFIPFVFNLFTLDTSGAFGYSA